MMTSFEHFTGASWVLNIHRHNGCEIGTSLVVCEECAGCIRNTLAWPQILFHPGTYHISLSQAALSTYQDAQIMARFASLPLWTLLQVVDQHLLQTSCFMCWQVTAMVWHPQWCGTGDLFWMMLVEGDHFRLWSCRFAPLIVPNVSVLSPIAFCVWFLIRCVCGTLFLFLPVLVEATHWNSLHVLCIMLSSIGYGCCPCLKEWFV